MKRILIPYKLADGFFVFLPPWKARVSSSLLPKLGSPDSSWIKDLAAAGAYVVAKDAINEMAADAAIGAYIVGQLIEIDKKLLSSDDPAASNSYYTASISSFDRSSASKFVWASLGSKSYDSAESLFRSVLKVFGGKSYVPFNVLSSKWNRAVRPGDFSPASLLSDLFPFDEVYIVAAGGKILGGFPSKEEASEFLGRYKSFLWASHSVFSYPNLDPQDVVKIFQSIYSSYGDVFGTDDVYRIRNRVEELLRVVSSISDTSKPSKADSNARLRVSGVVFFFPDSDDAFTEISEISDTLRSYDISLYPLFVQGTLAAYGYEVNLLPNSQDGLDDSSLFHRHLRFPDYTTMEISISQSGKYRSIAFIPGP